MKLKKSEARNEINEIEENLTIEIDSFIYQIDKFMVANPFLIEERSCYSALKFYHEKGICDIFEDESLVRDLSQYSSSDIKDTFERLEKIPSELLNNIDTNKVALRTHLSSLCHANLYKISDLYLIKQFNSIEFLSYALSANSKFFEYFNICKMKEDFNDRYHRYDNTPERKLKIHDLFQMIEFFIFSYEDFLVRECGYTNEDLTSNTVKSIIHNPMKIVLDAMYQKSKKTIDNYNLLKANF